MITEDKKYISGVPRTFGFALFTPLGTAFFQLLIFRRSMLEGYLILTALAALVGIMLLYLGYNMIKEKAKG